MKTAYMKTAYAVIAYRHGDTEQHSYVVGVFTIKEMAIQVADKETNDRGGNCACHVEQCVINHHYEDIGDEPTTVYKTKSRFEK